MRFNNRACALMDIPDLPQGAFEHCGDGKIKPQGGGGGGIVSAITDPISSALGTDGGGGGILGAVEDVGQSIGSGLAEVDKFVNREIPGGWVTVGLTAAGTAAYIAAADAAVAAGASTAEAAAAGSAAAQAADAAALLDAAALAEGGTTAGMAAAANTGLPAGTATIGGAATSSGAPIFDFSTEATLTPGGNVVPATTLPTEMAAIDAQIATAGAEAAKALPMKISPMQAIQGARLATGLLSGGQQQSQALPQMSGSMNRMPGGAVDYSGIYNLLALQRARNPNSLLG